jgi:SAM-dependent methyltransferase
MQQTPVHEQHNPDLLRLLPANASSVIEIGCSSGALAREYKRSNPACHFLGVEIEPAYAELAQRYCDAVLRLDIETADERFFLDRRECACWVFGDTLEHLKDPWRILRSIRSVIPSGGCVVACIPNAQHWSVQTRLCRGDFRYEDSGLLDRTHLRWFTRTTIGELFGATGYAIVEAEARIFDEPQRDRFLPAIRAIATFAGADPEQAVRDALPLQYVVKAVPA